MRIVAGLYKGHRIVAPRGGRTRPTADRVREAIFSILGSVEGARVLDLYAGSGALGIEALSRGARQATFVDSAAPACAAVRRNLDALGIGIDRQERGQGAMVLRRDGPGYLRQAARRGQIYDLVLIDPPYRIAASLKDPLNTYLPKITSRNALAVVESSARRPLRLDLQRRTEKSYGDTLVTVYCAAAGHGDD